MNHPQEVSTQTYQDQSITFQYPANAKAVRFEHESQGSPKWVVRIIVPLGSELTVRVNIDLLDGIASPQEEINRIYHDVGISDKIADNVSPFRFAVGSEVTDAWRCVKRFVDGASVLEFIDTVLWESDGRVYRAVLSAPSDQYLNAKTVFEAILQTLKPMESR